MCGRCSTLVSRAFGIRACFTRSISRSRCFAHFRTWSHFVAGDQSIAFAGFMADQHWTSICTLCPLPSCGCSHLCAAFSAQSKSAHDKAQTLHVYIRVVWGVNGSAYDSPISLAWEVMYECEMGIGLSTPSAWRSLSAPVIDREGASAGYAHPAPARLFAPDLLYGDSGAWWGIVSPIRCHATGRTDPGSKGTM